MDTRWKRRQQAACGRLIRPQELDDIRVSAPDWRFVHMETLRRFGMTELRPGQYVLVRYGPGSKGMMAAEIHPETGSPALSSH